MAVVAAALLLAGIAWLGPRGLSAAKLRWEIWRLEGNPDERYRLAERWYQAGDYEKARACCIAVLRREPSHAPARALRMEVEFILGVAASSPAPDGYGKYMTRCGQFPSQLIPVEIDTAFSRADRAYGEGDLETAERELRKILEYAKWMPTGMEIEARVKRAHALLESIEGYRCER